MAATLPPFAQKAASSMVSGEFRTSATKQHLLRWGGITLGVLEVLRDHLWLTIFPEMSWPTANFLRQTSQPGAEGKRGQGI